METIEKMKELASKNSFTEEEKQIIKTQCEKLSIEFNPTARCRNCYTDAAIQCVIAMRMDEEEEKGEAGTRLRSDVDVLVNGRRLNAATLTLEWQEELRQTMPEWWFNEYFVTNED